MSLSCCIAIRVFWVLDVDVVTRTYYIFHDTMCHEESDSKYLVIKKSKRIMNSFCLAV